MFPPAIQFVSRLGLASADALIGTQAVAAEKALLSPRIKSAITSTYPKFAPAQPAPKPASGTFWTKRVPRDDDVLELPKMTVEEKKFKKTELQTLKGKVDEYMNEYLGSKDGLDRGLLNKHALNKQVGPATVALFGATTNEDRALEARFDDQRLKHRDELLATVDVLTVADPEKAKWLRAQSRDLFYRKPDIRERR